MPPGPGQWQVRQRGEEVIFRFSGSVHIVPLGDVLEHSHLDCECLPTVSVARSTPGHWSLRVNHNRID